MLPLDPAYFPFCRWGFSPQSEWYLVRLQATKDLRRSPRRILIGLALVGLALFCLMIASQVSLTPPGLNSGWSIQWLAWCWFALLMGTRWSIVFLILWGVGLWVCRFPLTASGDGFAVLQTPTLMYWLGASVFLPAMAWATERWLHFPHHVKPVQLLGYSTAIAGGWLLLVNGLGGLGLLAWTWWHPVPPEALQTWFQSYSVAPFGYDLVSLSLLVLMARHLRQALWWLLY